MSLICWGSPRTQQRVWTTPGRSSQRALSGPRLRVPVPNHATTTPDHVTHNKKPSHMDLTSCFLIRKKSVFLAGSWMEFCTLKIADSCLIVTKLWDLHVILTTNCSSQNCIIWECHLSNSLILISSEKKQILLLVYVIWLWGILYSAWDLQDLIKTPLLFLDMV